MKKGEKIIFGTIGVMIVGSVFVSLFRSADTQEQGAREIPFYSTASAELKVKAAKLIKQYRCRSCHSLWTVRSPMQAVPAPALDGLGSLYDEEWFYRYFSAADPQAILPSRLKEEYRMPSFAAAPEEDRRILAAYMSSLKVADWYLEETRRREQEKLTGVSLTQ